MSEGDRLLTKVARLRRGGDVARKGRREYFVPEDTDLLATLLQEIDETVLPRRLVFESGNGGRLEIEATNRRILRVVSMQANGLSASHKAMIGKGLTEAEDQDLDVLFSMFDALVGDSDTLSVSADRLSDATAPADVGCSAERLAVSWGIDLNAALKADPVADFTTFVTSFAAAAKAWQLLKGVEKETSGGFAEYLGPLGAFSEAGLTAVAARLAAATGEAYPQGLISVSPDTAQDPSVLYAWIEARSALFVLDAEKIPEGISLFHRIVIGRA
ncbi:MAG: hypothetical protein AAGF74_07200 [Pseudomonadota bacterium]